MKTNALLSLILIAHAIALAGCNEPSEAPRVEIPVEVSAAGIKTVSTDLGYRVEVTEARIALKNLSFTIAGELHTASLFRTLSDAFIPSAWAHPGHYPGGEVTGELPGEFVIDWLGDDARQLGVATLISGTYTGLNFTFARGSEDLLDADDPLIGHTAVFSGVATRDDTEIPFTIVVDSPENRMLAGAPLTVPGRTEQGDFRAEIDENATGTLKLQLDIEDIVLHQTLFDGIDFAALADDGAVLIAPDIDAVENAYNLFRRAFQLADHYIVYYQE